MKFPLKDPDGNIIGVCGFSHDITKQKQLEIELKSTNKKLETALSEIKTLEGILPICASCKKIRDKNGNWNQLEIYIRDRSKADFTHSICPECIKKLYGEDIE